MSRVRISLTPPNRMENLKLSKFNYVYFVRPGTYVNVSTQKLISEIDTDKALEMFKALGGDYFGFYFETWERNEKTADSKKIWESGFHYVGGKVLTLEDIEDTYENKILRAAIPYNGWDKIVVNNSTRLGHYPFKENDVLLENV